MTTTIVRPEITPTGVAYPGELPAARVGPAHEPVRRRVDVQIVMGGEVAFPTSIDFGGYVHPGLRLQRPVPLEVRREDELIVVSNTELEEFGTGQTLGDAVLDFGKTLAELYFRLEEEQARLGSGLQRLRTTLDSYLVKR